MGKLSAALLGDEPHFDGVTYQPQHDQSRLTGLLRRVATIMSDGQWRTLAELSQVAGGTEASVSARLRDMRKARFGSQVIDRRRIGTTGLFQYRLVR